MDFEPGHRRRTPLAVREVDAMEEARRNSGGREQCRGDGRTIGEVRGRTKKQVNVLVRPRRAEALQQGHRE
jgi:hypothetical protein